MCGKNLLVQFLSKACIGSPPRVREKRSIEKLKLDQSGITPACAGKTGMKSMVGELNRDHPRVCGKNTLVVAQTEVRIRITPACAGKTQEMQPCRQDWWDHPRVCGKNTA